jgi:hypothetical protein
MSNDHSHAARSRIIAHKTHADLPGNWRAQKQRYNSFSLQVELPCINGLSAWFTVATFHEADDEERFITDGARQEAGEYAAKFAALAVPEQEGVDAALGEPKASEHLSPERRRGLENAIERIIQDACELPDRTSPEDQPDMLLITGEELDMLLRRHLGLEDDDLRSLSPSSEGGSPR